MCSSRKNDKGKGAWDLYRIGEEELGFFLRAEIAELQSVKNTRVFWNRVPNWFSVYNFFAGPPHRIDFF